MVKVYLDVIFATNLTMDFFILWTTARIMNIEIKIYRLALGAAIGGLYALMVILSEVILWNTLLAKVLFSVLILLTAFGALDLRDFLRAFAFFYLVSFVSGGAVIGFIYLTDSSPGGMQIYHGALLLFSKFNYIWLALGAATALLLAATGFLYAKRKVLRQELTRTITIGFGLNAIKMRAFMDTGNQLYEPFTNRPVLIVEANALKGYLPGEILEAVLFGEETNLAKLVKCLEEQWAVRLQIIPFNSVGKAGGIMLGIRPDYVEVRYDEKIYRMSEVIVGLVGRPLSREGKYQALLHPELSKGGISCV